MVSHIEVAPQTGKRHAYLMMEVEEFPGWRVTIRVDDVEGQRVVTEFRMTAQSVDTTISARTVGSGDSRRTERVTASTLGFDCSGPLPDAGLSTSLFRKVALDRLVRVGLTKVPSALKSRPWNEWLSTDRSRVGRMGRDDLYYAQWAASYVNLIDQGEPHPAIRLADDECLSASQVRSILGEARKRGLLSKAPKGRAGGYLTTLADSILSQTQDSEEK